jgi:hypothetical protein
MQYTVMAMMAYTCLCAVAQMCQDANKTHEFLILALDAVSGHTYSSTV